MTTAGTYYYPPSAGTGNLLLANPPFIMTTQQPTPAEGLPELTEEEFQRLGGRFDHCHYSHAFQVARAAYQLGADAELAACCDWLAIGGPRGSTCHHSDLQNAQDLRAFRRPKPPSLKEQALAAARIELYADGKNGALIIRALEALPD